MNDPNLLQIDAFTDAPFKGNPAAIVLELSGATDSWMQSFAREMNLSETAYLEKSGDAWSIRWFTPAFEVDLCGHATLAAAHALWETGRVPGDGAIRFESRSGVLEASCDDSLIWLDFPAEPAVALGAPPDRAALLEALGLDEGRVAYSGANETSALVQLTEAQPLLDAEPDFPALARLPYRGAILTAPGSGEHSCDFLSRYFAPRAGIDEDPVTGSAHCALAPFWSERLGRESLVGYQASSRGGFVRTRLASPRVHLGGAAVTVFQAKVTVPQA